MQQQPKSNRLLDPRIEVCEVINPWVDASNYADKNPLPRFHVFPHDL